MKPIVQMFLVTSFLFFLEIYCCHCQEENTTIPFTLWPSFIIGSGTEKCPAERDNNQERILAKENIYNLLPNVNRILNNRYHPPCACGGQREWSRIAHLNMTDPSQNCPSNWTLRSSPVRGCGKSTTSCDSAFFPPNGHRYSRVCGRVIAYQYGTPDAFYYSIRSGRNIDQVYMAGVSLTHGAVGARQHIWSFVAAISELDPQRISQKCSCSDTSHNWAFTTPSFVGNDYFCDTGNRGPGWSYTAYYPDDPLWDGGGCGSRSSCCEFNNPPWFCKELPLPTSDDIEIRNCGNDRREDVIITSMDIYVL